MTEIEKAQVFVGEDRFGRFRRIFRVAAFHSALNRIFWGDFDGYFGAAEKGCPFWRTRFQQPILPWPTTRGRGCLLDWQLFPIRIGSVNCPFCAVTVIDRPGASPDVLPASSGL